MLDTTDSSFEMSKILTEIVKGADEDFHDAYHLSRAKNLFRSAVYGLLSSSETVFDETDYPGLVKVVELVLWRNCALPNNPNQQSTKGDYFRILGGFFNQKKESEKCSPSMSIVSSVNEFNRILQNELSLYNNVMHIHLIGQKLMVYPFIEGCQLKYICQLPHNVFSTVNVNKMFSRRFILSAIEFSIRSFKLEIGAVV